MRHIVLSIAEELIYTSDRSATLISSTSCICGYPSVGFITSKILLFTVAQVEVRNQRLWSYETCVTSRSSVSTNVTSRPHGSLPRHGSLTAIAQHKGNCIGPWWICWDSEMRRPTLDRCPVTWKRAVLKPLLNLSAFCQRLAIYYSMSLSCNQILYCDENDDAHMNLFWLRSDT
jgi:hypothetical protein